jgi:hypothetical protein
MIRSNVIKLQHLVRYTTIYDEAITAIKVNADRATKHIRQIGSNRKRYTKRPLYRVNGNQSTCPCVNSVLVNMKHHNKLTPRVEQ